VSRVPLSSSKALANATGYQMVRRMQDSVTSIAKTLGARHRCGTRLLHWWWGSTFISACDIRLCSSDTVFSVREAKVAIVADLVRCSDYLAS